MAGKDAEIAKRLATEIRASLKRPINLMEVCGTHTVAIFRTGVRTLLPDGIRLLSGPGCPVCVTSIPDVDKAVAVASRDDVILATFGDMMRVPGSNTTLNEEKAKGSNIKIVYSPMDALKTAVEQPEKKVVFFATGFETTSPLVAATVQIAARKGVNNFFILSVHKLVPPALRALLSFKDAKIDGFILPGHVSTIIGKKPYDFIANEFKVPCVITGFEAIDIMEAIYMLIKQINEDRPCVEIQYKSVVREEGNPKAVEVLDKIFRPSDALWRGIGVIPASGLALRDEYKSYDAESVFQIEVNSKEEPTACSCGEVLRGIKVPTDCKLFGKACTPERPVGACMVSTEGSCSAYYKYGSVKLG